MLDAFIIDRIQREREKSRDQRPALQIEEPRPEPEPYQRQPADRNNADREDRGIVEVDFTI